MNCLRLAAGSAINLILLARLEAKTLAMVAVTVSLVTMKPDIAIADFINGSELLEVCRGQDLDLGFCAGYIIGVADSLSCKELINGSGWSPPLNQVTTRQVSKIALKWINEHPELHHYDVDALIARALSEAFPCP
jgi:hypothetical protein